MPTLADIGGAEPSTITFRVATVTQNVNGTVVHKEVLVLGDPDTTNAIAAVLNTTPGSTAWGIVTRPLGPVSIQGNSTVVIVSGNSSVFQASTAWQVQVTNQARVTNSSAADFLAQISGNSTVVQGTSPWIIGGNSTVVIVSGNSSVFQASSAWQVQVTNQARVTNSSAADFLVTVSGNSTVVQGTNPWIIAGNSTVAPLAGSTWATRPIQSSATDLRTMAVTMDGSSNTIESSTRAVGTNSTMRGLAVRSIMPAFLTTASSNVFASTTWTIATSNAGTIQYVYAYSITTTNQTPTKIGFYAGSTLVWPIVLAAISSAVSGVNLAVSPPAYLFAGATGAILQMKTASASTGGGYKAGVSYWTE